jgi:hypothetical protein
MNSSRYAAAAGGKKRTKYMKRERGRYEERDC